MWMGHWKKKWKIAVTVVAVLIAVLPYLVFLGITLLGIGNQDAPVDLSLSREEYVAACETVDPSAFYRDPWGCEGDFLSFDAEIVGVHYAVEDLGGREKFYTARITVGDSPVVILLWDVNLNCAGIDFFALIKLCKQALALKVTARNCADIHKVNGLCSADFFSNCNIVVVSILKKFIFKLN